VAATRRLIAVTILALAFASACNAAPTGASASNPCDFGAVVLDVGPVALCEHAIAVAEARLGWLHWPIRSTRFRLDLCPPNARCMPPAPNEAWVIFTFTSGDPAMVHVVADASGALSALDQESPPAWLLDELREQDPSRPTEPQDAGG
jgi:hypothetical protein